MTRFGYGLLLLCATMTACASTAPSSVPLKAAGFPDSGSLRGLSYNDLLYVTDNSASTVYVYTYPEGMLVEQLQLPLETPAGDCVDGQSDVFITGYNGHHVLLYSHGASQPKVILADPGYPSGCSVDATTGNLAVANYFDREAGPGNVAVWKIPFAVTPPVVYSNLPFLEPRWCSYDDKGNLFVDGADYSSRHVKLAELQRGATSFKVIKLPLSLGWPPGKVQWDGKYISIAVGNTVYRLSFSGSKGHIAGSTQLPLYWTLNSYSISGALAKGAQQGTLIGTAGGSIGFFKYPSGSGPKLTIPQNYPLDPVVSPSLP